MALNLKNLKLNLPSSLPVNPKFLAALVIIVVAVLYGYYNYSYKPKKKEIETLQKEIIDLKNKLAALEVQVQNLEETKRKLDSLTVIWQKVQVLLPDKKDVPTWFDDMIKASQSAGVNVTRFKPGTPQQSDKYTEYPFDIEFEATYHSLASYIAAIANHPRITKVSNLQLTGMSDESGEPWTLKGSMTVSTFVFNPSFIEKQKQGSESNAQKKTGNKK